MPRYDQQKLNTLAAERVSGTKLANYDMIVAVSQASVNAQMAYLNLIDEDLQKIHIDLKDPENDDDWTGMDAEMIAPQIKLLIGPNKQRVMFYLRLTTGKFRYYKGTGRKAKEESMDIKDWTIAFEVNLALEQMDQNQVPKDVQAVIKKLGDFSVHQLLVDFSSANIATYSPTESKFGIDKNDENTFPAFVTVMNKYMAKLRKADFKRPDGTVGAHSVINYVAKANRTGAFERAPSVSPTNFTFQALPFVLSPGDNGVEGVEEGKANVLVYLQVTNKEGTLPRDLLPISANWVIPTIDATARKTDGTIALSKAIFLDKWLLPKLEGFNKQSTWVVDTAEWHSEKGGFATSHKLGGHLGLSDNDIKRDPFKSGPAWERIVDTDKTKHKYKYSRYDVKDDDEGMWRVWMKGWTENTLTIPTGVNAEGKAVIEIKGQTTVHAYVHIDGAGEIGKSTGKVVGDWTMKLIMDGVKDGAMKLRFDPPTLIPTMTKSIDETFLHPGIIAKHVNRLENDLKGLDMTWLVNSLQSLFNDLGGFVLPGGRDFFMDRAMFNHEGDLLCELVYKAQT